MKLIQLIILLTLNIQVFSQQLETFQDIKDINPESHNNRTWTSESDIYWKFSQVRTNDKLNGKAITLNSNPDSYVEFEVVDGVKDLWIKTKNCVNRNIPEHIVYKDTIACSDLEKLSNINCHEVNDQRSYLRAIVDINKNKGGVVILTDDIKLNFIPSIFQYHNIDSFANKKAIDSLIKSMIEYKSIEEYLDNGGHLRQITKTPNLIIPQPVFSDVNFLRIYGNGHQLSLNSNIYRYGFRYDKKRSFYSGIFVPTAIEIKNSKNVRIENIELNGNVQDLNRESLTYNGKKVFVHEGAYGHGIKLINGVEDAVVKNVYVHHFAIDGITLSKVNPGNSTSKMNKNVSFKNIKSSNNARQGLTITGVNKATFNNCYFYDTGITEGEYGFHGPGAGLDIEPIHGNMVSNVTFNNCIFKNNIGAAALINNETDSIFFKNSYFETNKIEKLHDFGISNVGQNTHFIGCDMVLHDRHIRPTFYGFRDGLKSYCLIKDCNIRSDKFGIVFISETNDRRLEIINTSLIYTSKDKAKSNFPWIKTSHSSNSTINGLWVYHEKDKWRHPVYHWEISGINVVNEHILANPPLDKLNVFVNNVLVDHLPYNNTQTYYRLKNISFRIPIKIRIQGTIWGRATIDDIYWSKP